MIALLPLLLLCVANFSQVNAIDSGCDSGKEDVCNLPMRTGPCRAYFRVWGYNPASDQCESFVYGGCGGNANQFKEKIECERACVKNLHLYKHKLLSRQTIFGKVSALLLLLNKAI
uniref:WAP, kazal, immunoglobulin, kunitz and NTR n=1 Tax=Echinococcus granulosus TaxID=6210 RepID=A0A068WSM0_ECHGR|nr:WAP, kazal, immunoglobulin, kunitz and NTR [Echinococcus granulosus]